MELLIAFLTASLLLTIILIVLLIVLVFQLSPATSRMKSDLLKIKQQIEEPKE